MSNIQIPGNKGVPISPYPKEMYEQLFGCATINCDFTLNFQIPMIVPPNSLVCSMYQIMFGDVLNADNCKPQSKTCPDQPRLEV